MAAPAAAAPAATPADPVLVAALTGEFSKVYGGRKLRSETVKGLVALFAGRGQPLVDVVQHVNWVEKHEAIWVAFWSKAFARAEMAACDDLDFDQFTFWARARVEDGPTTAVLGNVQAKKALDVLDSNGYTIAASVRADIEAAMRESDAGDERSQCVCALAVWILFYGRGPLPDEVRSGGIFNLIHRVGRGGARLRSPSALLI